jgi:hypothetical protein
MIVNEVASIELDFKKLQLEKFLLPTKSLPKLNLRLQLIVKMGLICKSDKIRTRL